MEFFSNINYTEWVVIPLIIFFARICDVSIGTMRIMFVAKGLKKLAPLLGFFEILIWITVLGSLMKNLNNPFSYIAYAGGFAAGNLIGIKIEERIAVGKVLLRIITRRAADDLLKSFSDNNLGVTHVPAQGSRGPVSLIYSVIERKDIAKAVSLVKEFNPRAFYSIEDVKSVNEGIFKEQSSIFSRDIFWERK